MPETGESIGIASRQGKEYDESRIFEPDYNIDLGCWLLSFLSENPTGMLSLPPLHTDAGHSAVNRWLDDPRMLLTGKITPFRTRKQKIMLKRLKMHMKIYQFLRESEHEAGRG